MVDFRINEILPMGEVENLAYRVGVNAVRKPRLPGWVNTVRLKTAPTGLGECGAVENRTYRP